jgi:hypothetical protein
MKKISYGEDAMNAKKIRAVMSEDRKPSRLGGSIIFLALSSEGL